MTEPAKADDLVERLRDRDAIVLSGLFHAVPTMREAADTITALRAQLAKAEADGREATRLLVLRSETDKAEDAEPGHDTFAFLGKENSAGWVWAREVREERDFDAEQQRIRDLAMQAVTVAEENARTAESSLARAGKALEQIASGTNDTEYPFRAIPRELMVKLARAALQPDGDIKPHLYSPDHQAMGDCRVCGHNDPSMKLGWHNPKRPDGEKA